MKIAALIVLAGATLACSSVANAQVWNEVGDAGQNGVGAAQEPVGAGPLLKINGTLSGDIDLFCIRITNEAIFEAGLNNSSSSLGDARLFLFNLNGSLQVWNDDFSNFDTTPWLNSQGVFANGEYILGISNGNARPVDSAGVDVSTFGTWPGTHLEQRKGNGRILDHWNPNFGSGFYQITLRGVEYCIPTPGAAAVLGLAGLMASRRRRSAAA